MRLTKTLILTLSLVIATLTFTTTTADAHVVRGRCPQYEHLLRAYHMPVQTFSRIMYRESRCQPGAVNRHGGASGLLQVMPSHARTGRYHTCRQTVAQLRTVHGNLTCAARLYRLAGTRPWRTTR